MQAISGRMPPLAVEYDARGGRAAKRFDDPYAARRFYARLTKAGRRPAVKNPNAKETDEMATKKKRPAKTAAAKQPKKPANSKAAGTKRSRIRACLSKQPKTMRQLMDEAGVSETHYNFLNGLVEKGEVVKTDDGYRLA
jgi:hypothetical protein